MKYENVGGHCSVRALAALLAMAVSVPLVYAQQRSVPMQRNQIIGETIADRQSSSYRFERFVVSTPDRARKWRITLGVPRTAPPSGGFPVFWMLDGNAALMEFDKALLDELAARQSQVLVFVGYDNQQRVDVPARTRDYTPVAAVRAASGQTAPVGGGADAFLEVIEREIKPELARRVTTDPRQQSLWGHSFGGLFALHALYTRAGLFQTYAAASPSLWWDEGYMLGSPEQRFVANNAGHRTRLLLMLGDAERHPERGRRDLSDARVAAHTKQVAAAPSDSALRLSERLRQVPGLTVEYREFPGLGHGPMLRASLLYALHSVAGISDRSAEPRL